MLILADHENRPIYAEPEVTILVADFGSMQVKESGPAEEYVHVSKKACSSYLGSPVDGSHSLVGCAFWMWDHFRKLGFFYGK
jgi:hypothetical protein